MFNLFTMLESNNYIINETEANDYYVWQVEDMEIGKATRNGVDCLASAYALYEDSILYEMDCTIVLTDRYGIILKLERV